MTQGYGTLFMFSFMRGITNNIKPANPKAKHIIPAISIHTFGLLR